MLSTNACVLPVWAGGRMGQDCSAWKIAFKLFVAFQTSANNLSVKQPSTQTTYKSPSVCSFLMSCLKPASSILAWIGPFEHLLTLIWLSLFAFSLVPDLIFLSVWLHFYLHICCYEKDKLTNSASPPARTLRDFLVSLTNSFCGLGKVTYLVFLSFPLQKMELARLHWHPRDPVSVALRSQPFPDTGLFYVR